MTSTDELFTIRTSTTPSEARPASCSAVREKVPVAGVQSGADHPQQPRVDRLGPAGGQRRRHLTDHRRGEGHAGHERNDEEHRREDEVHHHTRRHHTIRL